jgi:hypothetical protein
MYTHAVSAFISHKQTCKGGRYSPSLSDLFWLFSTKCLITRAACGCGMKDNLWCYPPRCARNTNCTRNVHTRISPTQPIFIVFKEAICFGFHKAILRSSIDLLTSSILQCWRKWDPIYASLVIYYSSTNQWKAWDPIYASIVIRYSSTNQWKTWGWLCESRNMSPLWT